MRKGKLYELGGKPLPLTDEEAMRKICPHSRVGFALEGAGVGEEGEEILFQEPILGCLKKSSFES